jgi:formate/nitrite transporter FocA (FNT family)
MARKPPQDLPAAVEETYLESHEHEEALRRAAPRGEIVFESVRSVGEHELSRPIMALAWSGLAAGLSMGFSFLAQSLLASYLPQAHWRPAIAYLGYSVGFLIVILGRQQLFTENTLTPILVLLQRKDGGCLWRVLRLWIVVLVANTVGAFIFALLIAKTSVISPDMHEALVETSRGAFTPGFGTTLLRAIFAGWLIATLIWLLPFAETARVAVIIIITYVIALGHFTHIIASSVEAFYAVITGDASWGLFFGRFYVPALIGNIAGGVSLVAAINYAQITTLKEEFDPPPKQKKRRSL